jgi:Chaperone of endosialidase
VDNSCYIGSIFGQTSSGGAAVFINSSGKLGTSTSSRRFKEEIKAMDKASEALFSLKPLMFRYKKEIDPAGTQQFGLVAGWKS